MGVTHVQDYLDAHPDLDVALHYVWLPMFPRIAEERALPEATAKYMGKGITQYWDDNRSVGTYLKAGYLSEFRGDVVWDAFLLFDEEATWESAEDHLLVWGFTIEAERENLFQHLADSEGANS